MFAGQPDLLSYMPALPKLAPPAKLRPYQHEAVEAALHALQTRHHPVLALPTGAGKSRVIAALCDQLQGRILVATHRQELLEQNAAQLDSYIDGDSDFGIYSAGLARHEGEARIIFGGIQSIYNRMEALQQRGLFAYVIVDECHRVPPPSVASMYGTVFRACPAAQRIGLTATPYRLESGLLHEGTDTWFDCMPMNVSIRALTPDYLSPLVGVLTAHDIDVSQVRTRAGEFVSSDLSQAACEETAITGALDELCLLGAQRKKWLLFCVDVTHTRLVHLALAERGIQSASLLGTTSQEDRQNTLAAFRAGALRALVNCEVATTGFDIPDIDCVVMLRPTQSKALCVQMLGRGTRQAPGKQDCLVLDFAGNIERHAPLDELARTSKSAARQAADDEREREAARRREREAARRREREAKHRAHAALDDPMAENRSRTPKTYRVERVTYRVQEAKKFTRRHMLLVSYYCPERIGQRYITTFLCLEHDGWAREQAAAWFTRRDAIAPATAIEGLRMAWGCRVPSHIVVREDGQWPRVIMEQFAEQPTNTQLLW